MFIHKYMNFERVNCYLKKKIKILAWAIFKPYYLVINGSVVIVNHFVAKDCCS